MTVGETVTARPTGLLSPLRASGPFRLLFFGQLSTQTAIWVLTVAAQIALVGQGESTVVVALVQSAVTLPFLVVAIPSGVVADLVPRRAILVGANAGAFVAGAVLTALSATGRLGAGSMLALTFVLGLAWAMTAPTYQAVVPDVVPRAAIPAASMLSSINFNAARVVGPAVGGAVVALLGTTAAFALSSVGYAAFTVLALFAAIPANTIGSRRFLPALRTGLRHVVNAEPFRRLVVMTAAWFVSGSVLWALLPVVGMRELGLGPGEYGVVLAVVGGGAIVGTVLLAPVRARVGVSSFVGVLGLVYAACLVAVGWLHVPALLLVVLPVTGAAWTSVGAVLLAVAQQLLPGWVRARAIAYYLVASQGGMAVGSFLWGVVGGWVGVSWAFTIAAAALLPLMLAVARGHLPRVSVAIEAPPWAPIDGDVPDDQLDRPALVVVRWRVPAERREEFVTAMAQVRRSRRRTGARAWSLGADVSDPSVYLESFRVDSWHDHLEQHDVRQAPEDAAASAQVRRLVGPPEGISHFIGVLG